MNATEIAQDLISRGISPVPIPRGEKSPRLKGWQLLRITAADVAKYFGTGQSNVGGLMGPASKGLADVDLDCKEAIALAPFFLPETHSIYGRASKRRSHYLYTCSHPDPRASLKWNDEAGKCLIELRLGGGGKGAQSVMPGSIHGSGELYAWDEDDERGSADCATLKARTVKIAVCAMLIRHWPALGSRHDAALALGGFLARAGWTAEDIEHFVTTICKVHGEADDPSAHGRTARDSAERHAGGGNVAGIPKMIDIFGEPVVKQIAQHIGYKGQAKAPEPPKQQGGLPIAVFGPLSTMVDRAAELLLAAEVPIYQRGNKLVRPVVLSAKTFRGGVTSMAQLVEVDVHYLRDLMCKKMRWMKVDNRSRSWVDVHPPHDVALILLKRFGDWNFPTISGIITTPTLRPDGSILSAPGYDPATRLLLISAPPMPAIPEQPTKDDALAALEFLKGLLVEFPFVSATARSVALSAIISTVCRGAYPVLPMHVIDAPVPGSGKSYLLSLVSAIATGEAMPVIGVGKSEEETEKRIGAAVIKGQPLICLDNVNGELGGDELCRLIEQPRPHVRVLGASVLVEAAGLTYFANGNNIVIVGDLCRRVILCRLDPQVERPELREFKDNPMQNILVNRGPYIAAALTICRAYNAAERPNTLPQLASFGEWSDMVRSALVWMGEKDPVNSMDRSRGDDPETRVHLAMLTGWLVELGPGSANGVTLREVLDYCLRHSSSGLSKAVQSTTLMEPSVEILSYWMRSKKDRRVNGMWFSNQSQKHGSTIWWVNTDVGIFM